MQNKAFNRFSTRIKLHFSTFLVFSFGDIHLSTLYTQRVRFLHKTTATFNTFISTIKYSDPFFRAGCDLWLILWLILQGSTISQTCDHLSSSSVVISVSLLMTLHHLFVFQLQCSADGWGDQTGRGHSALARQEVEGCTCVGLQHIQC